MLDEAYPILCIAFTFWAMLSTTQDPNTSNLAVSIRVSYRLPAYGRLCLMLVHNADSPLIDTNLLYINYQVNQPIHRVA